METDSNPPCEGVCYICKKQARAALAVARPIIREQALEEAVQVAIMAMRMATKGDATIGAVPTEENFGATLPSMTADQQDVKNPDRTGHWRDNDHYDRDGYCDNPSRGY